MNLVFTLSQADEDAPVLKIFKNTFAATFSTSRVSDGVYLLTASGNIFDSNTIPTENFGDKNTAMPLMMGLDGGLCGWINWYKMNESTYRIETYLNDNGTNILSDDMLHNQNIFEIKKYA